MATSTTKNFFSAVINGKHAGFFVAVSGEYKSVSSSWGNMFDADGMCIFRYDNGLVKSRCRIPREERTNSSWDSSVVGHGYFVRTSVVETEDKKWQLVCPETGSVETAGYSHH